MKTVLKYYLRIIFLLFPIIFIPVLTDGFGLGRNLSLMAMAFIALVLWTIKLITDKEKIVRTNKLFWLFLLFVVWSAISFFKLEPGIKMTSFMLPLGFGSIVSLFVLFFVWMQVNDEEETKKQFLFLTVAGLITGVASLIVFLLPVSRLPIYLPSKQNPLLSITANWSLVGSLLGELFLLVFLGLGWLKKLVVKIKERVEVADYLKEAIATVFFSLLLFLDIYKVVKLGWGVLDIHSAWVIAAEAFKRNPIFGVGIGNFLQAFNSYRPASFNLTQYWTSTFSGSSMGILQVWTELGVVGLLFAIYLLAVVLKLKKNFKFWQVALVTAIVLFLPLDLMSLFLLAWLLSGEVLETKESKLILNVGENNFNVMPYLVAILVLGGVGTGSYWMGRIFLGDFYMRQALVAASKNDGTKTYQLEIKAIGFNQDEADYRRVYSQTNLALAQSLLSNKDISDDDKSKASTLVQQSVSEAKAAISLNQKNPTYWYNLAEIYRSLVGLVDGADSWSAQAYQQAIVLDPVNPIFYLNMGGLYYSAKDFDDADRAFEQVVTNKSDYANGWYNWANSAKQLNKLSVAVTRLEQAVKLVPTSSSDYDTASKELESWKAELATETSKSQSQAQQTQGQQTQSQQVPSQDQSGLTQPDGTSMTAPVATPSVVEKQKVTEAPVVKPTVTAEPAQSPETIPVN